MGADHRLVQGDVHAALHLVRDVQLEGRGLLVGLVPLETEHVGEEALNDAHQILEGEVAAIMVGEAAA